MKSMTLSTVDFCFSFVEIVLRILLDRDSLGKTGGNLRRAVGTRDISSFAFSFHFISISFYFLFVGGLAHMTSPIFQFSFCRLFPKNIDPQCCCPLTHPLLKYLELQIDIPQIQKLSCCSGFSNILRYFSSLTSFFRLSHLLKSCLFLRLDWISDNGSAGFADRSSWSHIFQ